MSDFEKKLEDLRQVLRSLPGRPIPSSDPCVLCTENSGGYVAGLCVLTGSGKTPEEAVQGLIDKLLGVADGSSSQKTTV